MKIISKHKVTCLALFPMLLIFSSCYKSKNSPGYEYMPDMYRTAAYQPGETNPIFDDHKTNQPPVEGSIARTRDRNKAINKMPYPYPNTLEGRTMATKNLKNPLEKSKANMEHGKELYDIYCVVCHGSKGQGDGPIVKVLIEKKNYKLQPPAYNSPQLAGMTEGQIFHATQYGKNLMGSYASQLTAYERWQVTMYVQKLQHTGAAKDSSAAPTDTTTVASADTIATASNRE